MSRLRQVLQRIPLTLRGALFGVAAATSLGLWGLERLDLLLLVVGATGVVTLFLATIVVLVAALWLRRRVESKETASDLAGGHLEAEIPRRTGFSLPALDRLPLLRIDWDWTSPEGVECRPRWRDGRWDEEVTPRRRTAGQRLERRFEVTDVLGLLRVRWTHHSETCFRVLPSVGRLRTAPVVQAFSAAEGISHPLGRPEGDRMEIRKYVPGDSARDIHWKAYARNRQLNVRLRERAIERSTRTVAYLVRGEGDEAAAGAARVALESEAFGPGWRFGADGTTELTDDLESALTAIARSGDLPTDHPTRLPAVLSELAAEGRMSCVVFVPGGPGSWTNAVLGAARDFPGTVTFVVATDGVLEEEPSAAWRRWLWLPDDDDGVSPSELRSLLGPLGASGSPLLVVDRPTGRSWSPGPARGVA